MRRILIADQLIDGFNQTPIKNGVVIIQDEAIEAITTYDQIGNDPEGEIIKVPGGTIMPGFIEMHAHMHCSAEPEAYDQVISESNEELLMRSVEAVRETLISGVTTVRDLGSKNEIAFAVKKAVEERKINGPRLLVTGTPITTTAGHCNFFGSEADTADQVIAALRHQVKLGADYIKIMSTGGVFTPRSNVFAAQYTTDVLRLAVEDADRLGVRIAAHCHGTEGVINCAEAGIHNLIHSTWLSADPNEIWDYRPEIADTIAEKGLWVDPTIAIANIRIDKGIPFTDDELLSSAGLSDLEGRFAILKDMWDRGVKFVTGLDTGMSYVGFGDFAYTPQTMVEGMGISEMEAIICSTLSSAQCLGIDKETGTLEKNKSADILIVDGDPLADIRKLHDIDTIISQGQLIKRAGKVLI
ncbi:MAG: Imidazolonepropionase [Chloroflexi bacterium]|jgi:imidazolonepropionase-like amidohydrolase|nr:MAG: Imidazolonepropionase [Chloroflexota bacterium]